MHALLHAVKTLIYLYSLPFLIRGGFSKVLVFNRVKAAFHLPIIVMHWQHRQELIMFKRGVLRVNDFILDFSIIDALAKLFFLFFLSFLSYTYYFYCVLCTRFS